MKEDRQVLLGQGERSIEGAVHYSLAHEVRTEILAILNEGIHSPEELSEITGELPSKLGHHIKALLDDGSIELVCVKPVRNTLQHFYRAVQLPFYTDEQVEVMSEDEKQAIIGVILEAVLAEALASFDSRKMLNDPRIWLSWRWFNVDGQGRNDIADEQARHWERMQEIEAKATDRRAQSGEEAVSVIVTSLGYLRSRTAVHPPHGKSGKSD